MRPAQPTDSIILRAAADAGPDVLPGYCDRVYPAAKYTLVATVLRRVLAARSPQSLWRRQGSSVVPELTSLHEILSLYRRAAWLTGPRFAFETGLHFHVSSFGMYGFAILSGTDYRQSLRFALRYHQLATPLAAISFREDASLGAWQVVPLPDPAVTARLYRFLVELQFGIITCLHRDVMGASFAARAIELTYPPIDSARRYAQMFGCPVRFERPANVLAFDVRTLKRSPPLGDAASFAELLTLCDERLTEFRIRVGFAGQVRAALLRTIAQRLNAARIAQRLHVSTRTLARRLHEHGLTLRGLQNEIKQRLAVQYLRDTRLHLEEIASLLGFTESTSLRKAFVRWTHTTPSRFRRRFADFGKYRGAPSRRAAWRFEAF